jgi:hypothetical protein
MDCRVKARQWVFAHGCPVEIFWTERMALILLLSERFATVRDSKRQRHAA